MVDRTREQEWLRSHLAGDDHQLLVLYGRRRVGKTTLVGHVLDNLSVPTVYYLCDQRGEKQNARAFAERCAEVLDDVTPAVEGFRDAFQYLIGRVDGPAVIALDEFSYLVAEDDTIPSVFQGIVDELLQETQLSLVLLGSSISMMEEGVLSYESPLYGRRTGQWRLEPMALGEVAGFFPEATPTELIQVYSVLGGIPAYLEQFDPDIDVATNIERHILSKGSFLYEEPEFLLRQELREPATYMAILEAIAGGATRVSEIAGEIDRPASSLSRYLQNLTRLALVERETPVTDPDGRGVYRLTDQYLRFWFRYVLPNRSSLEQGQTTPVRDAIVDSLPTHVSWTFEDVCRQAVRAPAFPVTCSRVGRWWDGEDEIDVVGVDAGTETLLLGECKWTAAPVSSGVLSSLEALESTVRWRGDDRTVVYALFAKRGFDADVEEAAATRDDVCLFTPRDLIELWSSTHE
ncbi:ATP-binding protein [Salinigranum halophilum]|uniref:ATP-binding protein n=1 Tax=Salinigranum halophilum TaxID=2565931 RepID=UPI0010A7ECFA|nr:ATP-binding protein [Salinigranum halophilum]